MTFTANRAGTWPPGLHWSAGETRELTPDHEAAARSMERPGWLVEASAPVAAPVPVEAATPAVEAPVGDEEGA